MEYNEFIEKLFELQDIKYKEFHSKNICDDNLIGVRVPELKKLAKLISHSNYENFFKQNKHFYYEENVVHGLVLGYLKIEFGDLKQYIDDFLQYINNWAVCDITVSNLKIFIKNKKAGFKEIKKYINDSNPWTNRFGYVLLLSYFVDDEHIEKIFSLINNYKDDYYVKMAIAWLLSVCYIKQKEKTISYLKNYNLDDWTFNKTIQKIIESNRISKEEKNILKGMKRK